MDISLEPPEVVVPDNLDEYRSAKLRAKRNYMLQECDWTQMPDSALTDTKKTEWAIYRQALRDLPVTVGTPVPETVTFPDKPS